MKRILWAIDASPDTHLQQHLAARALHALTRDRHVLVEPAYVYSPFFGGNSAALLDELDPTRLDANRTLHQWLRDVDVMKLLPPRFLVQTGPSNRAKVATLLAHAVESGADLIVAGTRPLGTVRRFFSGSFVEHLVRKSEVPVLTVGHEAAPPSRFDRILFPTDFSPMSREAFTRALDLARDLGASIQLFYKAQYWTEYFPSGVPLPTYGSPLGETTAHQREMAQEWVREAAGKDVSVSISVDDVPGITAEAIVDEARATRAPLIAMATQMGALASVILGSVTRQVLRRSPCPVWVVHPHVTRASLSEKEAA